MSPEAYQGNFLKHWYQVLNGFIKLIRKKKGKTEDHLTLSQKVLKFTIFMFSNVIKSWDPHLVVELVFNKLFVSIELFQKWSFLTNEIGCTHLCATVGEYNKLF